MTDITDILNTESGWIVLKNLFDLGNVLSNNLMVYIMVVLPFLAIWIASRKVILPAILYCIIGGPMMILAPWEIKGPAMLMFSFGVAGIVFTWFKDR